MKSCLAALVFGLVMSSFMLGANEQWELKLPPGRIAISHDGNNYDKDDYLASAMHLALIAGLDLEDKVVHFDHSCHLQNKAKQYEEMQESVEGAVARFGFDAKKVFDVQTQLDEAIANFKKEAEKSSAENPLWFCIGGPMEVPWRCLNAVDPQYLPFINCISHSSPFNERHVAPPEMTHDWDDLAQLGVVLIRIRNQNRTEWNTKEENAHWLRDSENPDLQWLYSRNAKKNYDCSDCGMLWWLITGATEGGNQNAGWEDYKPVLESLAFSPETISIPQESIEATAYFREKNGLVVMEAEGTKSELGLWVVREDGLENAAQGKGYLEFTGNQVTMGPANSPLEYFFKVEKAGLYALHLRCARETIEQRKDVANDCYVRLEGDYGPGPQIGPEHGDGAPLKVLQEDTKFYGGDHLKLVWVSGNRLDLGGHRNKRMANYDLKAGEIYKLVISGRSQKFKLDRILFRHTSVEKEEAEGDEVEESVWTQNPSE